MNMKAIAAIALTMIICVPIGAGYLLNMQDVEETGWQTTAQYNISDELINNTTEYYMDYNGVSNNNTLATSSATVTPAYVKTGSQVTAYPLSDGTYADVSQGWKLPSDKDALFWRNGQDNYSVTFLVKIGEYSTADNSLNITFIDLQDWLTFMIYNKGSSVWVKCMQLTSIIGDYELGAYDNLAVEINAEGLTVSGISGWPAFGADYNTLNTVHIPCTVNTIGYIDIGDSAHVGTYRVENTTVLAGTYPSTVDKTLNMGALYPGDSWSVKLNSIGVYGDSISINGTTYTITDGQITVDGSKVSLKGAMISAMERSSEAGTYDVKINNISLGSSSGSPNIVFNGEWSLTATAYILEEKTTTSTQWIAGGFGLDKSGMVAVGLMVAAACFVVLGMMGKMSGSKVAFLALICGGCSIVYLIIM